MRAGIGYDVHKLVEGRKLIVGGVTIPYDKGLLGHSDADVLLHAICDALLGAAGLGDIGQHFSDQNNEFKDADSIFFLKKIYQKITDKKLKVNNIDSTIIAEAPKMAPYRDQMKQNIADALEIDLDQINIKATTEEGMGFTGTGQGMAAWACVSLQSI